MASKPPYDLGILFIHGIGKQRKGETLLAFGEPIAHWLQRWLSESTPMQSEVPVGITDASLTGDEPAHAELTLTMGSDIPSVRWLMAECWWAKEIQEPSFAEMVRWSVQIAPSVLAFDFIDRIGLAWNSSSDWFTRLRRMSPLLLNFLLEVFLLPLLIAVMVVCLILVFIPLSFTQKMAHALQRTVSSVLGDCYVLVRSPIQQAAILSRLRHDVEWMQWKGVDKLCIVAHSQGAAIAHRQLDNEQKEKTQLLDDVPIFSLGSGERKLVFVERLLGNGISPLWSWFIVLAMLVPPVIGLHFIFGVFQHMIVVLSSGSAWVRFGYFVGELFKMLTIAYASVLSMLMFLSLGVRPMGKAWPQKTKRRKMDREYRASADPVPTPASYKVEERITEVSNRSSAIFDHIIYFENIDEFVGSLVGDLAYLGNVPLKDFDEEFEKKTRTRRSARVRALVIARYCAIIASGTAFLFSSLRLNIPVQELNTGWFTIYCRFIECKDIESLVKAATDHPTVAQIISLLVQFALIWGLYGLMLKVWKCWEAEDLDAYFSRTEYKVFPFGETWFWFFPAAVVEFLILSRPQISSLLSMSIDSILSLILLTPILTGLGSMLTAYLMQSTYKMEGEKGFEALEKLGLTAFVFIFMLGFPPLWVFFSIKTFDSTIDVYRDLFLLLVSFLVVILIVLLFFWFFRGRVYSRYPSKSRHDKLSKGG